MSDICIVSTCCIRALVSRGSTPVIALAAALATLAWSGLSLAGDIKISGEVEAYVESGNTNFGADYNTNERGLGEWLYYFGNGLTDTYNFTETRVKEAEIKLKKETELSQSWTLINEIEIEFKPINSGRRANDYDIEEMSAIFKNTSGLFIAMGILEDKKLYDGGLVLESASNDAKGFDENPGLRIGYQLGDLTLDGRYQSIFKEVSYSYKDATDKEQNLDKVVNQTSIRLQAEYKRKGRGSFLGIYEVVNNQNKEEAKYQEAKEMLASATEKFAKFEAEGLHKFTNIGLGLIVELGKVHPTLTYEDWDIERDDGIGADVSTQIITAGVRMKELGPGNLVLEIERGTSDQVDTDGDKKGDEVTFTALAAEYHWTEGKSRWGPGFKQFSNDASEEKLKGTIFYFGGEYIF